MHVTGIVERGLRRVPYVQVLKLKQSRFRDNDYESMLRLWQTSWAKSFSRGSLKGNNTRKKTEKSRSGVDNLSLSFSLSLSLSLSHTHTHTYKKLQNNGRTDKNKRSLNFKLSRSRTRVNESILFGVT